jgi:nucleotide-binding universal stress UspA family protein
LFRSILVAVDPDRRAEATRLLEVAAELRRSFDATLTLATVMSEWSVMLRAERSVGASGLLGAAEARLAALAHSVAAVGDARFRVETGRAHRGILNAAAGVNADLILLPSRAPKWQDRLFGTTALRVARNSSSSVFIIRD